MKLIIKAIRFFKTGWWRIVDAVHHGVAGNEKPAGRRVEIKIPNCVSRSVAVAFFLYSGSGNLAAETYFVSVDGDDAQTGGSLAPFRTVQRAIQVAGPGDTVKVGAGSYSEEVKTVRGGAADARITIDGQEVAQITSFSFKHPYISLRAMTVSGKDQLYSQLVYLDRGAHYAEIDSCFIDAEQKARIRAIAWRSPSTKPFGSDAASHVRVVNNTMKNVLGFPFLLVYGDNNLIEGNHLRDGGDVDFINVWGRNHIFRGNVFENNSASSTSNHPDFIQTFTDGGYGSVGHLIDSNIVKNMQNAQLAQLSNKGLLPDDQIGDWTFQNNVFAYIGMGSSCTIANIRFYNNLFHRCNYVNRGAALNFGKRHFEKQLVLSGAIVTAESYLVKAAPESEGGPSGSVLYDGTEYGVGETFTGVEGEVDYSTNSPVAVHWYPATYAHGTSVMNNVFYDCGSLESNITGWYQISQVLQDVTADHNMVSKSISGVPNSPVRVGDQIPVGGIQSWESFRWWEPNGINGGDPGFVNASEGDFRLRSDSPLIDQGSLSLGVSFDREGTLRPQGSAPDIGPIEYTAPGRSKNFQLEQ